MLKKKLYIFNPYPSVGGADTTILRLLSEINYKLYDVEYFSIKNVKNIKNKKIKLTKIDSNSTMLSFFKIIQIIKKDNHKTKIFFSLQYFVNVWTILFIKLILNVKTIIYEINDLDELNYSKNSLEFIKKKILKLLVAILYKYSDAIIGNSKELSFNLQGYVNKKVETVYNPSFHKVILNKKKFKPWDTLKILNIARFEDQKDQNTLLKAINISKAKKKIKLILVGYGSKLSEIKKYINQNKINAEVIIKPKNHTVYYERANLFINSSIYEGLPTTMIEAASYCLPIISSDFKSGSKEILINGKGGYIFRIGDYKRLSQIINLFYENPASFYTKEKICRKNLDKFSIKKNIYKFYRILDNLS